ncbi:hypothetical protein HK098_000949 [Nowakowskiella sp. JEL0407]|nr:hypothetical protein HK098_000949 [Nowakowskiella sp. JEL0407]
MSRHAELFKPEELLEVNDPKNRILEQLYLQKLNQFLIPKTTPPIFRKCKKCKKIYPKSNVYIKCEKFFLDNNKMTHNDDSQKDECRTALEYFCKVGFRGEVWESHVPDPNFNITQYVASLVSQTFTYKQIYWKLYTTSKTLYCTACDSNFPAIEIGSCSKVNSENTDNLSFNYKSKNIFSVNESGLRKLENRNQSRFTPFEFGSDVEGGLKVDHKIKKDIHSEEISSIVQKTKMFLQPVCTVPEFHPAQTPAVHASLFRKWNLNLNEDASTTQKRILNESSDGAESNANLNSVVGLEALRVDIKTAFLDEKDTVELHHFKKSLCAQREEDSLRISQLCQN